MECKHHARPGLPLKGLFRYIYERNFCTPKETNMEQEIKEIIKAQQQHLENLRRSGWIDIINKYGILVPKEEPKENTMDYNPDDKTPEDVIYTFEKNVYDIEGMDNYIEGDCKKLDDIINGFSYVISTLYTINNRYEEAFDEEPDERLADLFRFVKATFINEFAQLQGYGDALQKGEVKDDIFGDACVMSVEAKEESVPNDNISRHYENLEIEPIEVMKKDLSREEFKGYLKGNIIKYILRAPYKGQEDSDYKKAAQYSKWLSEF